MTLGSAPATAAGPDLRQLVLGSEGAFGVITSVTVRVAAVPEEKVYEGWRWPTFARGRRRARRRPVGLQPTVLRLSDEAESADQPGRPERDRAQGRRLPDGRRLRGHAAAVAERRAGVTELLTGSAATRRRGARPRVGARPLPGAVPARLLLDLGVLVETLETATFWSGVEDLYAAVKAALEASSATPALVLCHVSHVYETGLLALLHGGRQAGRRPAGAVGAAKRAPATRSSPGRHHHPPPRDRHRPPPWLEAEIGPVGVRDPPASRPSDRQEC
jgi:alkyldihydroxyacetonephosphate synthase